MYFLSCHICSLFTTRYVLKDKSDFVILYKFSVSYAIVVNYMFCYSL